MAFNSVTHSLFRESALLTKNATITGIWVPVKGAEAFHFAYYMTAAGAPSVTISIDYTFWMPGYKYTSTDTTFDPDSATRNNYVTVALGAAQTTKAAWVRFDTPSELKYPVAWIRGRAVEGDVALASTFSLITCCNGMK